MKRQAYTAVKRVPTHDTTRPFALRLVRALLACRKGCERARGRTGAGIGYVILAPSSRSFTRGLRPVVLACTGVHVDGGPEDGRGLDIALHRGGPRVAPGAAPEQGVMDIPHLPLHLKDGPLNKSTASAGGTLLIGLGFTVLLKGARGRRGLHPQRPPTPN